MTATTGVLVRPTVPAGLGRALAAAVAAVLVTASIGQAVRVLEGAPVARPPAVAPSPAAVANSLAGLPMAWAANTGQSDPAVRYLAQGMGYSTFLTDTEAVLRLDGTVLRLGFDGAAEAPVLSTERPLAATVSSFAGSDPNRWQSGASTAEVVRYHYVWPGIEMTMRGNGSQLEWDLHVAAGADPAAAGMTLTGTDRIEVDGDRATLVLGDSELPLEIPAVWQARPDGTRIDRTATWDLQGDTLRVLPEDWDPDLPGVIDPTLDWSTFLGGGIGGGAADQADAITVDATGSYVTGTTQSNSFPTTAGSYDTVANGIDDVFVAKLDPTGATLLYGSFLGSLGEDHGLGIAVDAAGAAYVTGSTLAGWGFPTTAGAYDRTYNGNVDVFVAKLDPSGATLGYSTLLGSTSIDVVVGLAVDAAGAAYVGGHTFGASSFPKTVGAYDTTANGDEDAFVTKVAPTGATLVYSTLLGGSGSETVKGIALDGSGSAYLTGWTSDSTTDLPTTAGAYDTTHNGSSDGFATKLSPSGAALAFSTFVGGASADNPQDIAVDASGHAFIVGTTGSADYPTTPGAYLTTGTAQIFVTELDPAGAALVYSTRIGTGGVGGVAVDATGSAYLTGSTSSPSFPTTIGAYDVTPGGSSDAYVTKLSPAGDDLAYSTLLGGSGQDLGLGIVVEGGHADVAGLTADGATDYPTTAGALDETHNGANDGFVTKLDLTGSSLAYSTLLGGPPGSGGGDDFVEAVAIDATGVYATGSTSTGFFPTTVGTYDTTTNGGNDVYLAKLDPTGSVLVYSTLVGGSGADESHAIAVDASGNVYLTGSTSDSTTDYPTTPGAYDTTHNGSTDAFATKVNATGTAVVYSTLLGGSGSDNGQDIAVDGSGSAYLVGTAAAGYPTTAGAFDTTQNGNSDVVATKLDPTGASLAYSTFLGGGSIDVGRGVAVDASGHAYLTGWTHNTTVDYPTTPGAYDTTHNDGVGFGDLHQDAFLTKLAPSGGTLVYSTFLGSDNVDEGNAVAVDAAGNAYVVGRAAPGFPTTAGAYDTTHNGSDDAFVTKVNPPGTALAYSTFLGGNNPDAAYDVTVDATGSAFLAGVVTTLGDFPVTTFVDGAEAVTGGAFLSRLDPTGSDLVYSTVINGTGHPAVGIARSPSGKVVIGGGTGLPDLPATAGTFDPTASTNGGQGFVSLFDLEPPPPAAPSGCTAEGSKSAVIGWFPANPGAQSSLKVACSFNDRMGESMLSPSYTIHDARVAQYHNGAGRQVRSLGAVGSGASSIALDPAANGIAGITGWVNRVITGPGIGPRTFVTGITGGGVATLSRPTVGAIAAGDVFTLENGSARSVDDASGGPGSTSLSSASASFTAADVGASVEGTGIDANTTIASVTSATVAVMSAPATLTDPTVTIGATALTTSTRQVTGAATTSTLRVASAAAGWAAGDVGLAIRGTCDNGASPDYVVPADVYIISVSGSDADTTGGLATGQTGCNLTVGDPSATAPLDGEVVADRSELFNLNPALVPGTDACGNDQPEGFARVARWFDPGSFEGAGATNAQPGTSVGAPTKVLGQLYFDGAAVDFSAFVVERLVATPGDPIGQVHYDVQFPLVPTATAMCPGTDSSPGMAFSLSLHATTASQSTLPAGTGRPGTAQVRSIRPSVTGGYNTTAYVQSDTATTFTPTGAFRRLCAYPPGTPNPINFQCGAG